MKIEPMQPGHVQQVVAVHLQSFQGFFLTFLGPRFLHLFYNSICEYPQASGFVYSENGQIGGFVCGAISPSRFYRFLIRKRAWQFGLAALGSILRKPAIFPRLLRALLYPSQTSPRPDAATLMSIAVDPQCQGRGIGQQLVRIFLEDMRQHGVGSVDLTTDRLENDRTNRFYQSLGFSCERTFTTAEGRQMNEYVIKL